MPFQSRNAYYLRISASTILPLYVYLDERHINWMSDRVLQHVLEDLRTKIMPKLKAEQDADYIVGASSSHGKKGTVDVHRGETYQFAYFFRATEPHSVLVKSRNFVLDKNPPKPPPPSVTENAQVQPKKRKGARSSKKTTNKKRKVQGKRKTAELSEEEIEILSDSEDDRDIDEGGQAIESQPAAPRRSTRARRPIGASYRETDEDDIDMADGIAADVEEDIITQETGPAQTGTTALQGPSYPSEGIDIDTESITIKDEETEAMVIEGSGTSTQRPVAGNKPQAHQTVIHIEDDEEPKPKLSLQLKYQGFQIHGHCLCVVVEPWPPIRSASRAPSLAPMVSTTIRAPSIAPPDFVPSGAAARRERTPLFLPDDDQDRGETPGPSIRRMRTLPPVPLFNDIPEEERQYDSDEDGGMMEFSQVLKTGGTMNGGVEEDDEYDGALFFADADEEREL